MGTGVTEGWISKPLLSTLSQGQIMYALAVEQSIIGAEEIRLKQLAGAWACSPANMNCSCVNFINGQNRSRNRKPVSFKEAPTILARVAGAYWYLESCNFLHPYYFKLPCVTPPIFSLVCRPHMGPTHKFGKLCIKIWLTWTYYWTQFIQTI